MASISSASRVSISRRDALMIALASLSAIGLYLAASGLTYRLGFPLDDSWIHATYARNLTKAGEWAFQLGQPSAGSTAPLWTLLLIPGYWIGLAPLWWSYVLGFLTLVSIGTLLEITARRALPAYRPRLPWLGLLATLEWHLVWASVSGMETLLHALAVTGVIALLIARSQRYALLGILTGLSTWIRPDGLTLIGPVLFVLVLSGRSVRARIRGLLSYTLALGCLLLPYVLVNLWLSGAPMPNTFYAKQTEYAAWQAQPLLLKLGTGLLQISIGPFVLLWPSLVISVISFVRARDLPLTAALLWAVGYVLIYLVRLPAYQHGRYLMPAIPVLTLLAFFGLFEFIRISTNAGPQGRVALGWGASLTILTLAFLLLGARAYGQDVALIESEMVDTAKWSSSHLAKGAVIAAHDIGALGYFDHHELVDLAGLVSPEVVPIIRDEAQLAVLLDRRHVAYFIAFPDLYPGLQAVSKAVHSTGGPFAPPGLGNMTVYCWRCR